jgi:hypothetical protein
LPQTAEHPVVKNKPDTNYPQDLSGIKENTLNEFVSPDTIVSAPEPKTITMENQAAVETEKNEVTLPEPFNIRVLSLPYQFGQVKSLLYAQREMVCFSRYSAKS